MSNWMMSPARISNHNHWWRPIKQIGLSSAQEKMSGASLILSLSALPWYFFSFSIFFFYYYLFFLLSKLSKCLELFYLHLLNLEILGMHFCAIPDGRARTQAAEFPGCCLGYLKGIVEAVWSKETFWEKAWARQAGSSSAPGSGILFCMALLAEAGEGASFPRANTVVHFKRRVSVEWFLLKERHILL